MVGLTVNAMSIACKYFCTASKWARQSSHKKSRIFGAPAAISEQTGLLQSRIRMGLRSSLDLQVSQSCSR